MVTMHICYRDTHSDNPQYLIIQSTIPNNKSMRNGSLRDYPPWTLLVGMCMVYFHEYVLLILLFTFEGC